MDTPENLTGCWLYDSCVDKTSDICFVAMKPKPSPVIDTGNGTLTFGDLLISADTTYSGLRAAYPDKSFWEVDTGYVWIYFADIVVGE